MPVITAYCIRDKDWTWRGCLHLTATRTCVAAF